MPNKPKSTPFETTGEVDTFDPDTWIDLNDELDEEVFLIDISKENLSNYERYY